MSAHDCDVLVLGSGLNGLAASVTLARAGLKTLVLERNGEAGGAVRSGELTQPGFVHDRWATNMNLFLSSPLYMELKPELERHGFTLAHSDKPYCNLFPSGNRLAVYRDRERTRESLGNFSKDDASGWDDLRELFGAFRKTMLPLYGERLPSLEAAWTLLRALRREGYQDASVLAQIVLSSTRELGDRYFRSDEAKALISTWGMHLDFGPDVSGGAMFPFVEAFSDAEEGISISKGGAGRLTRALVGLIEENAGEVRTNCDVDRILCSKGRAVGVRLQSGETLSAKHAIIANLTPGPLFGRLLRDESLPPKFVKKVERYVYGPGTMMMHLALKEAPSWRAGDDTGEFAYLHIAPYVEDLSETYTAAMNGKLPASPLLIVGQTSVVDPTRIPGSSGEQILWIQVRCLPSSIRGDVLSQIEARSWEEAAEPFAERVMAKLESYAPGIRDIVTDQVVESPLDLERENPCLVGGDSVGGSHHLSQNFIFRPIPGWSRYKLPIEGLFMCGAGTYPGGGVHALSGYQAAQEVLAQSGKRDRILWSGALFGVSAGALASAWLGRQWRSRPERVATPENRVVH